jgi:hypothetical protein
VHSTQLKEQLLAHFPDMRAHDEGRDVSLMFDYNIGPAVLKASQTDCQRDALCLSRAAQIVSQEIFQSKLSFNGTFPANCQEQSVPKSLLALVCMILEWPSVSDQSCHQQVPGAIDTPQLIVYNSVNHARPQITKLTDAPKAKHVRLSRQLETPLPLYGGLDLYAKARKSGILTNISKLGVCVSYDCILTLTTDLASTVCETYNKQQIVCPPHLHKGVFTVGAVDNIDHNPTSTTAKGSFLGTAISLMQHPTPQNISERSTFTLSSRVEKKSVYTTIDL